MNIVNHKSNNNSASSHERNEILNVNDAQIDVDQVDLPKSEAEEVLGIKEQQQFKTGQEPVDLGKEEKI